MGARGPRPTPTKILRMRGSWRANTRGDEPTPPPGAPTCPAWLDKEAKTAWRALMPMMVATGLITRIDRNALARYVQYYARWKKAEQFIQQYGSTYPLKDEKGQVKCFVPFPEVAIASKLGQLLARLEQEFGLTPSARSRISVDMSASAQSDAKAERDRRLRIKYFSGA